MPHLAVRHGVHDHDTWKNMFDEFAPHRRLGWALSFQIFRFEDAANSIAPNEMGYFDNARTFLAGDELCEAIGKAVVESKPVITFLNAEDSGKI